MMDDYFLICTVMIAMIACSSQLVSPVIVDPVLVSSGELNSCPLAEDRETSLQNITNIVQSLLPNIVGLINGGIILPSCGEGVWFEVAHLDMSDPMQHCPSSWAENGRACQRPGNNEASCVSAFYSTEGREYRWICGRVTGRDINSPDGFITCCSSIDREYVDGVSVTSGMPRDHIWSFSSYNCPCVYPVYASDTPSFVGDNFFCQDRRTPGPNGNLWAGENCLQSQGGLCCPAEHSSPWFTAEVDNPTSEDIEVRICGDESTGNENIQIVLLQLFVA